MWRSKVGRRISCQAVILLIKNIIERKMKLLILVLFSIVVFNACNENNVSINEPIKNLENKLIVSFQLLDSTNLSKAIFNKSEEVLFELYLGNQLYQDLSYSYTGFPFIFEIIHNDSIYATSIDYTAMELIERTDSLRSGNEKYFRWFAPNTFGRIQNGAELEFIPGLFKARIQRQSRLGYLNEIPIEIKQIDFEIVD
jgi:hypothetical protein